MLSIIWTIFLSLFSLEQNTLAQDAGFISVPAGFKVDTYASNQDFVNSNNMALPRTVRSIVHISDGILYIITYVAPKYVSRGNGVVVALIDIDADGTVDKFQPLLGTWEPNTKEFFDNLAPTSIAIDYSGNNQDVYFTTYDTTLRCHNVHDQVIAMNNDADRLDLGQCEVFFDWSAVTGGYFREFEGDHGRHFSGIEPHTNNFCLAMGADCGLCEPSDNPSDDEVPYPMSRILCCPTDVTPLASVDDCVIKCEGMRNSVGFDFHPMDNNIWFTDNSHGNSDPDDKLSRIAIDGQHFGFPYCQAHGIGDEDGQNQIRNIGGVDVGFTWTPTSFVKKNDLHITCEEERFVPPIQALGCHGVGMGLRFYDVINDKIAPFAPYKFPNEYHNSIFIASRGRGFARELGYPIPRVLNIKLDNSDIIDYSVFADGWQPNPTEETDRLGRPTDVEVMVDGSLLISDEFGQSVYRITFEQPEPAFDPETDCMSDFSNADTWFSLTSLPNSLGAVVSGIINNVLYVVGEPESLTFAYQFGGNDQWQTVAARIFPGHHHSSVTINNEWWLIGGLSEDSEGKIQVYNPATNTWREKKSLPLITGSVCSTFINNIIYVCGGIVLVVDGADFTTDECAFYDITNEENGWDTSMKKMPFGRNNAATTNDGNKMYIFGGRNGDNVDGESFDNTQIYDPNMDTWIDSENNPSKVSSVPFSRGGMGTAVFYNGLFYVFGGETNTEIISRVDIYYPIEDEWLEGSSMINPRYGIYPVHRKGLNGIYIAGGIQIGESQSMIFDKYCPTNPDDRDDNANDDDDSDDNDDNHGDDDDDKDDNDRDSDDNDGNIVVNTPSQRPSVTPEPSIDETAEPTEQPTEAPTDDDNDGRTYRPTHRPTAKPIARATARPTSRPTARPTERPTTRPTERPTERPTTRPTERPTARPTLMPTSRPTGRPTSYPTRRPTRRPTLNPTNRPTDRPTGNVYERPEDCCDGYECYDQVGHQKGPKYAYKTYENYNEKKCCDKCEDDDYCASWTFEYRYYGCFLFATKLNNEVQNCIVCSSGNKKAFAA